jgi:hypothetical protein
MGYRAGFGYVLWPITQDLEKHSGTWRRIWFCAMGDSAKLIITAQNCTTVFKSLQIPSMDSDDKKCTGMYLDSTYEGLHHPSFKSLVYARKIGFPALAHSTERILNSNNSAN